MAGRFGAKRSFNLTNCSLPHRLEAFLHLFILVGRSDARESELVGTMREIGEVIQAERNGRAGERAIQKIFSGPNFP